MIPLPPAAPHPPRTPGSAGATLADSLLQHCTTSPCSTSASSIEHPCWLPLSAAREHPVHRQVGAQVGGLRRVHQPQRGARRHARRNRGLHGERQWPVRHGTTRMCSGRRPLFSGLNQTGWYDDESERAAKGVINGLPRFVVVAIRSHAGPRGGSLSAQGRPGRQQGQRVTGLHRGSG